MHLSIDLGTTNSVGCYYLKGKYEMVQFETGKNLLPSVVEYKEDGSVICGSVAKTNATKSNHYVISNSKRIIGRPYNRNEVQKMSKSCGMPIINKGGKPYFRIEKLNKEVSPEEVASEIIKTIVKRAEEKCEQPVTSLTITVPAHFDNNQRTATEKAAKLAGFTGHVTILNEPTAAAICYGLENDVKDKRVLVYDLGGGTFDVSIVHIHNGKYEIEAYGGDNALGGADFDNTVAKWIEDEYRKKYDREFIPDNVKDEKKTEIYRRLLAKAETAKIHLSSASETEISVDGIIRLKADEEDGFTLTLEKLNELISSDIDRSIETVRTVMRNKGYGVKDIDHVVLVGGSSNLCIVKKKLEQEFGANKLKQSVDPSECVAIGGCKYSNKSNLNIKIDEKIAYSLGTSLINNQITWIIPRNSPIPTSGTSMLSTSENNQFEGHSSVYQGNSDKKGSVEPINESIHTRLPDYSFSGIPPMRAEEPNLQTTFHFKEDGILFVSVKEVKTGKELLTDYKVTW